AGQAGRRRVAGRGPGRPAVTAGPRPDDDRGYAREMSVHAAPQLAAPVDAQDVPPVRPASDVTDPVVRELTAALDDLRAELVTIRRDLHAHPELARTEERTTRVVADRLRAEGLTPHLLTGSGLWCDIGPTVAASGARRVAL